jgi:hypothetical protein
MIIIVWHRVWWLLWRQVQSNINSLRCFEPWIGVKWLPPVKDSLATTQLQRLWKQLHFIVLHTAKPACLFCRLASDHFPGDGTLLPIFYLLRSDNKEIGGLRLCALQRVGFVLVMQLRQIPIFCFFGITWHSPIWIVEMIQMLKHYHVPVHLMLFGFSMFIAVG